MSETKLQYNYDNEGQLLSAVKSVNRTAQKAYTYTYDTYGNIRTATDGTTSYYNGSSYMRIYRIVCFRRFICFGDRMVFLDHS